MAVKRNYVNQVYGLGSPISALPPQNIFANRAPSSSDQAELGTVWIYKVSGTSAQIYILAISGTWIQLEIGGGSGVFSSLIVNGSTELNGSVVATTANGVFTVASGTGAINIGADAAAKVITIGNVTGTSSLVLRSGTGGVAISSTTTGDITLASADTLLLDSAGVLELNSSAGVISIGNDAVAQNINIGTGAAARVITIGNTTGATGLQFNAGSALSKFNSGVATAPVNSSVATAAFVSSLTAGTSVQNTTGYDLLCNITVAVSSSTAATITLGVGSATNPTANTVVQSFTDASTTFHSFSAWVPNAYYLVVNTTGTIVVGSINVQSCPL